MKKVYILILLLAVIFYLFSIFLLNWFIRPVTCSNFTSHEDAQKKFLSNPKKYAHLDRDHDFKACESR